MLWWATGHLCQLYKLFPSASRCRDLPDLQTKKTAFHHECLLSRNVHTLGLLDSGLQLSGLLSLATVSHAPAFLTRSQQPHCSLDGMFALNSEETADLRPGEMLTRASNRTHIMKAKCGDTCLQSWCWGCQPIPADPGRSRRSSQSLGSTDCLTKSASSRPVRELI